MGNTESSYDKIDPAALLVAVLAVSIAPILGQGAWGYTASLTAFIVGAIVFCFVWPHKR